MADALKKAAESCKKCGIDALNADTKQALQSLCDDQQKHLTTNISPKITNGEKLEEELKGLRTEHETATKTLEEMRVASGLPLKKFFNTSGLLYKELGLKDKLPTMSEDEQLALLATDGMLVKRPLLVGDSFVLAGFTEAEWESKLR